MNKELVLTYHLKKEKSENSNYELFNENIDNFANNNENKKIRLFGKEFVSNNKNKCFLIINNKKSELVEYYYLNNKEKINDKLVIKYIEKEKLTDMSYMFSGCKNLLSISNALKWDISEVNNISYLFSYCESLKYLPDILSYWDTSNLTNMNNIFSNCLSLNSIPDISGWKTSKIIKMKDIFFNCKSLKSIPNISNWNLSNIKFIKDYINEQNFLENKKDLLLDNYLGKYDLQLKSNCICKIKGSEYGLGIFCKIPIDKIVLLTSYKVLNEKYLLATKDIIIKLNSRIKIMNKKDRRIWCNAKLNYTCIEILEEDYIQDFYYLDENLINDNLENYYKNKFIILISLFENKKIGISNGLIINSKMDNLIYSDDSFQKFSEGFIINQQNNCIIGIHKEKYKISKEKNENKNKGIYMINIIQDINNNELSYILKTKYFKNKKYKIILGGDSYSGKTTFLENILGNKSFMPGNSTYSIEYFNIERKIGNFLISFQIFDTPRWGEKYSYIINNYIIGSDGIFLLFALNKRKSFLSLNYCYEMINDVGINLLNVPILLLGNKEDLSDQRETDFEEAYEYSRKKKFVRYFEISSLNGKNVEEAFNFMAKSIFLINNFNKSLTDI